MKPFLSVVIPCRNERPFLGRCLDSILAGDYPKDRMEVLVIDGASTDGTRELIASYVAQDRRICLIENPEQTTPAALNRGIDVARGEIIARVDAHSTVARDYLVLCVEHLTVSGADNVGGPMTTVAQDRGPLAEPIVAALGHRFGVGNSYFRIGSPEPRWVDTVFGGCWRREIFTRVGLFNPALRRSQDMEFSLRLKAAGGRTLLAPDVRSEYYARARFASFLRHNFLNGEWAVLPFVYSTVVPVSLRHLIPLFFVTALLCASALAPWTNWPLAAIGLSYGAANLAASCHVALTARKPTRLVSMPIVFMALHLSYGLGSLAGLGQALLLTAWRGARSRGRLKVRTKESSCLPQR